MLSQVREKPQVTDSCLLLCCLVTCYGATVTAYIKGSHCTMLDQRLRFFGHLAKSPFLVLEKLHFQDDLDKCIN